MPGETKMKDLQYIRNADLPSSDFINNWRKPTEVVRSRLSTCKSANDEEMPVANAFIYSENAFKHEKKVGVESESKLPQIT